jgi:hypothetical protein
MLLEASHLLQSQFSVLWVRLRKSKLLVLDGLELILLTVTFLLLF